MAAYLLDTNILLRLADPAHPQHSIADQASDKLLRRGDRAFITPQNVIELWAVATRPLYANGLGLDQDQASALVRDILLEIPLLPDTHSIFLNRMRLVSAYAVSGKKVHDTRLWR